MVRLAQDTGIENTEKYRRTISAIPTHSIGLTQLSLSHHGEHAEKLLGKLARDYVLSTSLL